MQQPEPVADFVHRDVALFRHRFGSGSGPVAGAGAGAAPAGRHARHRVAVDPAPVLPELRAALLDDGREVAVSADGLGQVREEVDVERVVAAPARGGAPGEVAVKVGDADARVLVEPLGEHVVDDARDIDEGELEAVAEVGRVQHFELGPSPVLVLFLSFSLSLSLSLSLFFSLSLSLFLCFSLLLFLSLFLPSLSHLV
ncbi:hypothetical protein CTA2_4691 [Colletotrichum tanaceti]|nr:hypothetical protein CTA2_4691 [Colletotrichum tanaceti]